MQERIKMEEVYIEMAHTLQVWRAFSIIARSFRSERREPAGLPAAAIFFSFNFETTTGSKS